jgi:hypothetical protein
MKKILFLFALCATAGFSSCSEKTCECTVSVTVMGQTVSETVTGPTDGNCENIPEINEAKKQFADLASMGAEFDINCKEK